MKDYYARENWTTENGRTAWVNSSDKANQNAAKPYLEEHLGCKLKDFGDQFFLDMYGEHSNFPVCLVEFKARSHLKSSFPDVYLSFRRWLALRMFEVSMQLPAYFAVRWLNELGVVGVCNIPTSKIKIGGARFPRKVTDVEPLIQVPVESFVTVKIFDPANEPMIDLTKSPFQK